MLSGRLALVTGGGSGIGRAVCQTFTREGAKVIAADINAKGAEETVKSLGEGHLAVSVNVGTSESVNSMLESIIKNYSRPPCIVVNSAGITRDSFMSAMTEENFDKVININLKGTYLVTQAASQLMIKSNISKGSIVNIGSIVGKLGNMGQCNYAASKAGVEAFTKSVAKELAKNGIRCNIILPGFIETPIVETIPDKVKQKFISMIPLGRMGKPAEIADVCLFLASDKSSFITGTKVEVTGGFM